MAEESNTAPSSVPPTSSGPETLAAQEENGSKAVDVPMEEPPSESLKEGAVQSEGTDDGRLQD